MNDQQKKTAIYSVFGVLGIGAAFFLSKCIKKSNDKKKDTTFSPSLSNGNSVDIPITLTSIKERKLQKTTMAEYIKTNQTVYVPGTLKIPHDSLPHNTLLEELIYYDSATYPLARIPHLAILNEKDQLPDILNPLSIRKDEFFYTKDAYVLHNCEFESQMNIKQIVKWPRAGPKKHLYFNPQEVKALILTCGGLCPGLNVVIREIVMCLYYNYGVTEIYGAPYGYLGIYSREWKKLIPDEIKYIHQSGGTYIGTSRGGFDLDKIMKAIIDNGINQLYIIGGDGTHRGIFRIFEEIKKRQLDIAICGIPKTIDNDIPILDASFGFQTGIEEAQHAIETAWVESHSAENGIGLVKLMGRDAGWIALGASYAARSVNICLIPEFPFELYGEKGVLNYVYNRLKNRGTCIIVVAEGAVDSVKDLNVDSGGQDPSGNKIYGDIGIVLKNEITKFCKERKMAITLKYIDPSYMIRACPANAFDSKYCSYAGQNAVHASMFGYTGHTNGLVNGKNALIPITDMISGNYSKKVPPSHRQWRRFLQSSGQPSFINDKVPVQDPSQQNKV